MGREIGSSSTVNLTNKNLIKRLKHLIKKVYKSHIKSLDPDCLWLFLKIKTFTVKKLMKIL